MELFFRYPNKIFSPEHLMETFWVMDSNADINVIWTYISFLRKKLKEKWKEAAQAVFPIIGIVLLLCFTIAPISPSVLLFRQLP